MGAPAGNQNAKVGREWREALRRAMAHKANGDYRDTLLQIASTVVEKAIEGETVAWQEIANREDGKPEQAVALGNKDGEAFQIVVSAIDANL